LIIAGKVAGDVGLDVADLAARALLAGVAVVVVVVVVVVVSPVVTLLRPVLESSFRA
jgi:hypothetical protein